MNLGYSQHVTSSTISLLLAREVDDIVNGVDDGQGWLYLSRDVKEVYLWLTARFWS